MASGVRTIVLVDGVFHNTQSVWPREILNALEEDIQVIGAASMGALRAAELHPFGMLGDGTVFEWYRDGVIEADDEVAVIHAEATFGFRPMSEALVNIRHTLDRAVADRSLAAEQADQLLDYARRLYYPDRSYHRLLNSPVVDSWSEHDRAAIRRHFLTRAVNLKTADAIGVLRRAARLKETRRVAAGFDACRPHEDLWHLDRLRLSGFLATQDITTGETVLQEARNDPDLLASMRTALSKRCFLLEWARHNDVTCPDEFLESYIERWEQDHGIDETGEWLRANGLTRRSYKELLAERALVEWITSKGPAHFGLAWEFGKAFRDELVLLGRTAEQGQPRQAVPAAQPAPSVDPEQSGAAAWVWVELSQRRFLLEWARQNGVSCPPGSLDAYKERWERTRPATDRTAKASGDGSSLPGSDDLLVVMATVDWITSRGPNYFGLLWAFEAALLGELQITGRAAQLLKRRRRP
jgi:hypothetical protein